MLYMPAALLYKLVDPLDRARAVLQIFWAKEIKIGLQRLTIIYNIRRLISVGKTP
jgi:hypothetical protein